MILNKSWNVFFFTNSVDCWKKKENSINPRTGSSTTPRLNKKSRLLFCDWIIFQNSSCLAVFNRWLWLSVWNISQSLLRRRDIRNTDRRKRYSHCRVSRKVVVQEGVLVSNNQREKNKFPIFPGVVWQADAKMSVAGLKKQFYKASQVSLLTLKLFSSD